MCKLLNQHKDCNVPCLKNALIFKVLDEVITANSKLSRLLELVEMLLFGVWRVEFTEVCQHLFLLYLSS